MVVALINRFQNLPVDVTTQICEWLLPKDVCSLLTYIHTTYKTDNPDFGAVCDAVGSCLENTLTKWPVRAESKELYPWPPDLS
eukprot:gene24312-10352_t